MRAEITADRAALALGNAIIATADRGDWVKLGLLTGMGEVVSSHRRLLRSLEWGDDDYEGHVYEVLPVVLGDRGRSRSALAADRYPNLKQVEEHVGLREWLAENDRELFSELYAFEDGAVIADLEQTGEEIGIPDIETHAARIRHGLHNDPAQAIGSAKELLETTLKAVLELHGTGKETKLEIPQLIKQASAKLDLDPSAVGDAEPGAEQRRKVLGALGQIVYGTAELRNAGLGTGHGISQGPVLDIATARLVVSAAVAVATFFAEAHAASTGSSGAKIPAIPF